MISFFIQQQSPLLHRLTQKQVEQEDHDILSLNNDATVHQTFVFIVYCATHFSDSDLLIYCKHFWNCLQLFTCYAMIAVNQESELRTSVAPLVELLDAISM